MKKVSNKNVLIVENLLEELAYLTEYTDDLIQNGYQVSLDTARTIEDAKTLIKEKKFDALLLDLMLPEDQEKLIELERAEVEREALWKQYNDTFEKSGCDNENHTKLKKVRKEIERLDNKISMLLNDDGGFDIVKFYYETYGEVLVIFYSARGAEEIMNDFINGVNRDMCCVIEKPATVQEICVELIKKWN